MGEQDKKSDSDSSDNFLENIKDRVSGIFGEDDEDKEDDDDEDDDDEDEDDEDEDD